MTHEKQAADPRPPETQRSKGPMMAMCPMAKMCMRMMEKRPSGVLLMLPGLLLIVVGALIVIEPKILVWLIAAASVFMGVMLLMMAGFLRKMGAQLRV